MVVVKFPSLENRWNSCEMVRFSQLPQAWRVSSSARLRARLQGAVHAHLLILRAAVELPLEEYPEHYPIGSMVLVYMLTWLGYIDGIHGTPYIAAPWISHGYWFMWKKHEKPMPCLPTMTGGWSVYTHKNGDDLRKVYHWVYNVSGKLT